MRNSIYVTMEMQDGTSKLAEALQLRGFQVKVKNDYVSLVNGSEKDVQELKYFLDKLNIPVYWNKDQFQLLVNRFPLHKMKEIIQYKGRNYTYQVQGYHLKWRSFANRRYGIRTNTMDLCPYTAMMLKALNEAGIVTISGCNGHHHHNPNFQFSGVYFGIWFSLIQEKYLKNLSLHYQWKVEFLRGRMTSGLIANKSVEENWNMKKILADCEQMANALRKHASTIRNLKKNSFKRGMKETPESFREKGDMKGLYDWMKKVIERNS
ncbi:hypothetical protein [Sutcliffiella cohnii]|uniref:hypothetical protein n=1 Tax=Sutcliffiella cohnii TaxID=33932 RepID=UPI002E242F5E|nr:hypothetical protein [Sutcliffiella cohnii]